MTLKEIAARAGVHISTVSRILSSADDSFGSREVRERVWGIVKEVGYVPNPNARALRRKQKQGFSDRIGSLACVLGRTRNLDDNPFFEHVARAVEQQALSLGYTVQVSHSVLDAPMREALASKERPDGAIVLGRFEKADTVRFLESRYSNIVFVGRSPVDAAWDQVICDGYEATEIALRHLIVCGHRRIAYIGEIAGEVRYRAYLDILREYGIERERGLTAKCRHNCAEGGYRGADALLRQAADRLPTAVFCASDVAAIAAMRRFREAKIKMPSQLSVVSLDNIELSGYVSPMLTTVGMPMAEMGNVAVQTLISRINKLHRAPLKIYLPNKLALRESVAKLNEGIHA